MDQHAWSLRANRVRHRRAHTDWRKHHHVVCELEHDLRKTVHRAHDRFPFFANCGHGEREQHTESDDLENVAAYHRVDHARRKRVHNRFDQRFGMALLDRLDDVDVAGRESYASSGLSEIHNRKSDEQRRGGDDLEINQRFDSHPSDLFQCAGTGDADHDGGDNQRRDDRLDQLDENVAQEITFVAPIGLQPSDQCADDQANHDLRRQRWTVPRPASLGWRRNVHFSPQISQISDELGKQEKRKELSGSQEIRKTTVAFSYYYTYFYYWILDFPII